MARQPSGYEPGWGGIEHCGDSTSAGPEAVDSASLRPRICAATQRVYVVAPDVCPTSRSSSYGVQRHRRVRTHRIQVSSARLVNRRQDAIWNIGRRFHALLRCDVGWVQVPSRTSMPDRHRSVGDLAPMQSTVKSGGFAQYPKAGQVREIVASPQRCTASARYAVLAMGCMAAMVYLADEQPNTPHTSRSLSETGPHANGSTCG